MFHQIKLWSWNFRGLAKLRHRCLLLVDTPIPSTVPATGRVWHWRKWWGTPKILPKLEQWQNGCSKRLQRIACFLYSKSANLRIKQPFWFGGSLKLLKMSFMEPGDLQTQPLTTPALHSSILLAIAASESDFSKLCSKASGTSFKTNSWFFVRTQLFLALLSSNLRSLYQRITRTEDFVRS